MTVLTGTIKDAGGNALTGYMHMKLSAGANLLSTGGCGGPLVVDQVTQVFTITAGAITHQNGTVTASPSVYGTDCLSPSGLWYDWTIFDTNDGAIYTRKVYITGVSIDLGSVADISGTGTVPAGTTLQGDVTGTTSATVVERLRGRVVATTAPTLNQVLAWDGVQWAPVTVAGTGTVTGGPFTSGAVILGAGGSAIAESSNVSESGGVLNALGGLVTTRSDNTALTAQQVLSTNAATRIGAVVSFQTVGTPTYTDLIGLNLVKATGITATRFHGLLAQLNTDGGQPSQTALSVSASGGIPSPPGGMWAVYADDSDILSQMLWMPSTSSTAGQIKVNSARVLDWYRTGMIVMGAPSAPAANLTHTGSESVIIGAGAGTAITTSSYNVFMGSLAGSTVTTGGNNMLLGYASGAAFTLTSMVSAVGITSGDQNTCYGSTSGVSSATASRRIAIGSPSVCEDDGAAVVGSPTLPYLQLGTTSANALDRTLRAAGARAGTDSNTVGSNLILAAGKGTGNATPATIAFQTTTAGASGTTAQTLTTRLTISHALITAALPAVLTGVSAAVSATKTGAYSTTASDFTVPCDPSGGAFTVTLDNTVAQTGQVYNVKNVTTSTNAITIAPSSGTIDGTASIVSAAAYANVQVQYLGSNAWSVL
jgi:hypothetical protein